MKLKRILFSSTLILSCLTSFSSSQTIPKISINTPTSVDREVALIQLTLEVENEKDLSGAKLKHTWLVYEDGQVARTVLNFEQGKSIVVPTKKTKILKYVVTSSYIFDVKQPLRVLDKNGAVLLDAKVYVGDSKTPSTDIVVDRKNISSDKLVGQIKIIDENPEPIPVPPDPTPIPPAPVPQPGKYGLAKIAYDLAMEKVLPADRAKASPLAASYDNVAARITASKSKVAAGVALTDEDLKLDDESIINALKLSNGTALGGNLGSWLTWNTTLAKDVIYDKFYNTGLISSPDDWVSALKEIANGLHLVK